MRWDLSRCVHEVIADRARRRPDAIAVCFEDRADSALRYDALCTRAGHIAAALRRRGVGPGARVGVALDRGVAMVPALLGVLEAGAAYVPIDPRYPRERVAFMLDDARLALLVTEAQWADSLPDTGVPRALVSELQAFEGAERINDSVEFESVDADSESHSDDKGDFGRAALDASESGSRTESMSAPRAPTPDDLAYVMYTSGSTGRPKGAQIHHRGIVNLIAAMAERPGLGQDDVVAAVISLSHDMSVADIFVTLGVGARLVVVGRDTAADPVALARVLEASGATFLAATPSTFRVLLDVDWRPSRRVRLLSAGEALPPEIPIAMAERGVAIWNGYGMTEASVYSTLTEVRPGQRVTIGGRMRDTPIYILDDGGQPVPAGTPGELYVGGVGVGPGYWRRPALTAERFPPDPFAGGDARMYRSGDLVRALDDGDGGGDIEYLGRIDQQVKIRGFRVELGEIEARLGAHPAVRAAVVHAHPGADGPRLVAYIVPAADSGDADSAGGAGVAGASGDPDAEARLHLALRAHVAQALPEHMVPSAWVTLDALPQTPMGKIDRGALPAPGAGRPVLVGARVAPASEREREVIAAFEAILGVAGVGAEDDFFTLGGHSLSAARLAFRLGEAAGVHVPPSAVFANTTPARLAELLAASLSDAGADDRDSDGDAEVAIEIAPRDPPPPASFTQQSMWFIHALDRAAVEYHISAACELRGPLDVAALARALSAVVARHEALRTTLRADGDRVVQVVGPWDEGRPLPMPVLAVDHMVGDPMTDEREREVQALARAHFRRPFDLESGPGPLMRAALVRLSETEHRLLLCMHHAVADGWSLGVLHRDLVALYAAEIGADTAPLPPLPVQYADYAVWQRAVLSETRTQRDLAWWREALSGAPPILALPGGRARPAVRRSDGAAHPLALPAATAAALRRLARRARATPYMALLAGFAALLREHTGQTDLPIGTMMANRPRRELEHLIGYFANTLVIRVDAAGAPTFRALVERVRDRVLGLGPRAETPMSQLVRALRPDRAADQQPLFQVCFILQPPPRPATAVGDLAGDLTIDLREVDNGSAPFDLMLQLWEASDDDGTPTFAGNFLYRADAIDADVIAALADRLVALLGELTAAPDRSIDCARSAWAAELERALCARPEIADAAVCMRARADGRVERVAYVAAPDACADRAADALSTRLQAMSEFRTVDRFAVVARIPLTAAGEPDRDALARLPIADRIVREAVADALAARPGVADARVWTAPLARPRGIYVGGRAEGVGDGAADASAAAAQNEQLARPETTTETTTEMTTDTPGDRPPSVMEGPPLESADDAPKTLVDALRRAAQTRPDRGVTWIDLDGAETLLPYSALLARAARVAAGLRAQNIAPGTPVILQMSGNEALIVGVWGCILAGLIAVPVAATPSYDPRSGQTERLLGVWRMLGRPHIVADDGCAAGLAKLAARLDDADQLRAVTLGSLLAEAGDGDDAAVIAALREPDPDEVVVMLLTSGSTGLPKGVPQTHRRILAFADGYGRHHQLGADDVYFNWLPLDHVVGLIMCHMFALICGARQIHAVTAAVLERPLRWLDWMHETRATFSWAPNFAFGLINAQASAIAAGSWDLSRMRVLMNAGESIVSATVRRFLALLEPHGLPPRAHVPAWGMSELCSVLVANLEFSRASSSDDDPFVNLGPPAPGFAMRVVNDAGEVVPMGEVGRLEVRGAAVMDGYYQRPDINAEVFKPGGWFDTGDLAILNPEGMAIVGRSKSEIIIRGINYHSHVIESAVEQVAGVARSFSAACAVRGPGDDTDRLTIFFSPREWGGDGDGGGSDGGDARLAALIRRVDREVSRKVGVRPTYVLPVGRERIPKTEIGKIQRKRLQTGFHAGDFDAVLRDVDAITESERALPSWFCRRVWRRRPLASTMDSSQAGRVLVLAPEAGLGAEVAAAIAARADAVIATPATPAAGWRADAAGARFAIDPANPDHYRDLLAACGPIAAVIHGWTLVDASDAMRWPSAMDDAAAVADDAAAVAEALLAAQDLGAFSALHLIQALADADASDAAGRVALIVATQMAQQVRPEDEVALATAPLLGLLASVPHELPRIDARAVDVAAGDAAAIADALLAEAATPGRGDGEVAYRDGARWVARVDHLTHLADLAPDATIDRGGPLDAGPVLITGGVGGVGAAIAADVARRPGARVLLVGRTAREALAEEPRRALAALEARAGEAADAGGADAAVVYEAVDVADAGALAAAALRAERAWGERIAAVVHAAGVDRDAILARETVSGIRTVLGPRLVGACNAGAVAAERGAAFIDMGSVSEVFGGFGAGAYGAGCRFGDALAHELARVGIRAHHLLWSRWDDLGMSRGKPGMERAALRGYRAISAERGARSLRAALAWFGGSVMVGVDAGNPHIRRRLDAGPIARGRVTAQVALEPDAAPEVAAAATAPATLTDDFGVAVRVAVELGDARGARAGGARERGRGASDDESARGERPATEAERRIAAIWADALGDGDADGDDTDGAGRIGAGDNFFDLGGHSLLLVQVQRRLEAAFGRQVPMVELFRYPTPRALAAFLTGGAMDDKGHGEVADARARADKRARRLAAVRRARTSDRDG